MDKYLRINRPSLWRRIYLWWINEVDFRWEQLNPKNREQGDIDAEIIANVFGDDWKEDD